MILPGRGDLTDEQCTVLEPLLPRWRAWSAGCVVAAVADRWDPVAGAAGIRGVIFRAATPRADLTARLDILSATRLPAGVVGETLVGTGNQGVTSMPGDDAVQASEVGLFDNEDVDVGEEAPDDEDFPDEELAAIMASQAEPDTADPDAEVS